MDNTLSIVEQLQKIETLLKQTRLSISEANRLTPKKSNIDKPNFEGFQKYLEKQERSPNTIISYLISIKHFFAQFSVVNTENITKFKEYLVISFKPRTVNKYLAGIASYSKFLGCNITIKGLKIQKPVSVENVITSEEFNRLLNGLKNDNNERCYWLVMFFAKTGARVSEIVRFTKKGLLQGYEEMHTKGKVRRIYYPQCLIEDSREYFKTVKSQNLFVNIKNANTLTVRCLQKMLSRMARRYNIRKEVMHPHSFRHFFAKEFLRNGGDLTLLSDLLGHENVGTTSIYTRSSTEEMAAELSRLTTGHSPQAQHLLELQQKIIQAQQEIESAYSGNIDMPVSVAGVENVRFKFC